MPKKNLIPRCYLSVVILFSFTATAQTIENSINLYGTNFPQEKIHIHFDKECYLPGETIWFKAYLFEENLPSERSTNFYAAIYDDHGKLVKQQISPIFSGTTDGHFDIPDSIKSTRLICRAYTTWMLNFDTSMLFAQSIKLINFKEQNNAGAVARTTSLNFFPEGGDIIEGTTNTIAFKANYNDGLPFLVNATIKKQETGEVLMPLTVLHNGMGKFDIDIEPGDKYYAEWIDNTGTKRQTSLPEARRSGVALKLALQKDKFYFNLFNKTDNDSLHVLMYMFQKVFYKTNLKVAAGSSFTGIVPTGKLPAGVMQITVFDANWQPVAERIAFNNNNAFFNAAIFTKQISVEKRGKNILEISTADTIAANMSLSISDAEMNNESSENTILSNLLLKGDIKGYIHNPAFYFTNPADATLKDKLDLVMLTHGWRRYNWADMMAQKMPAIKYPADEYLGVYGQVGADLMRKLEKEERVNLVIKTADSTNNFYSIVPDKAGLLKQTGLVFYDSARVFFTFNKNKINNNQIAFGKYNFTHPTQYAINNYKDLLKPDTTGVAPGASPALFEYYRANNINKKSGEKTLSELTVKASRQLRWQNNPLVKLDEKYAKGLFAGGASGYALDLVHDEKAWTNLDVYQYLRTSMPGLNIGAFNNASGRSITYNRREILIFIDEHQMFERDLENLDINKVAYIKLIPFYPASGMDDDGFALKAALSVYTRKGDDLIDRRPTGKDMGLVKIAGYSPLKEFYSPDYDETNTAEVTDARTTLLWMPYILTDKLNKKMPVIFYNNDFTKKMRIVLEGVNDEGKMIRIEKIIE